MNMTCKKEKTPKGEELPQDDTHTVEKLLTEEIIHILERNQTEKFLRSLLTRALILEEYIK